MTTENTALTDRKPQGIKAMLQSDTMRQQFALALPKHLTPERFVRVATTALTRTPKLAECTQESLFKCLLDLSAMGLEPDGRRAHLIPYGKECTLIVDYKGLAELVMRSGLVASLHADKVCESDAFEVDRGKIKKHSIDYRNPRGSAYAYYVLVTFKDGSEKCEVMSREEIEAVRKRSRSGNSGPWSTDYDEMAKKTVFRRASKWLSLSPEIRMAVDADEEENIGMRHVGGQMIPPAPDAANPFEDDHQPDAVDVDASVEPPAGKVEW